MYVATYNYTYNANGQVAHVVDTALNRVQESEYDLANRPCRVKLHENGSHVYTGEVEYDGARGNLAKFTEKVGTGYTKYETTFGYDNEDRPTTLSYGNTNNQTILTYDGLGRVTNRTVKVNGYNTDFSTVRCGFFIRKRLTARERKASMRKDSFGIIPCGCPGR